VSGTNNGLNPTKLRAASHRSRVMRNHPCHEPKRRLQSHPRWPTMYSERPRRYRRGLV